MDVLIVFSDPLFSSSSELTAMLDEARIAWKELTSVRPLERGDVVPSAILVAVGRDPEGALELCKSLRGLDVPIGPTILLSRREWAEELANSNDLFDELMLTPGSGEELRARLALANNRKAGRTGGNIVEYDEILVNVTNYQASVATRPLDMTYMEYKLLKYFVINSDRVLTREQLLRDVWGYEYFGGARTVDVHVRRLRAKLGEEHAHLIQTVRSVGYLFSRDRWDG